MKIGILTFVHAYNYGAELQCFALQRKLRNLGYNVEVLDVYRPIDPEYHHMPTDKRFIPLYHFDEKNDIKARRNRKLSTLLRFLISPFTTVVEKRRSKSFKEFHILHTALSARKYYNYSELYDCQNLGYTHFIVGSDQVWNYSNGIPTEPYFLTFARDAVKVSYAASIGHSDIPQTVAEKYKEWLKDFKGISLRESQGVKLIKEITGRQDVVHVLDPVFLLSKEEWMNYFPSTNVEEQYIAVYLLSVSHYAIGIAQELAEYFKCKIKIITTKTYSQYRGKNIEIIKGESPAAFVSLFANAKFIVTNSFHGTAFAINFNKPFITVTRRSKRVNSRFTCLFDVLSISNRLVYEDDNIKVSDYLSMDYTSINQVLTRERVISIEFLKTNLAE